MSDFKIHNISFTCNEYAVSFSFTKGYQKNAFGTADLQLPHTSDSQDLIDDTQVDDDNPEHSAVYEQLESFYFDSFNGGDCAAASALLGQLVYHVEEVEIDGITLCVAFGSSNQLIKESRFKDYYNKANLFDFVDPNSDLQIGEFDFLDQSDFIALGERQYSDSLSQNLIKYLEDKSTPEGADEDVTYFLNNLSDYDFRNEDHWLNTFYTDYACDVRADFERGE